MWIQGTAEKIGVHRTIKAQRPSTIAAGGGGGVELNFLLHERERERERECADAPHFEHRANVIFVTEKKIALG